MASADPPDRLVGIAERLAPWADADGVIPFERFHAVALHDPEFGYYRAPGRTLGPTGDFYTAPQVHPMFGAALADRIRSEWARLGSPAHGRVVEVGAGDGALALAVLTRLVRPSGTPVDVDYVIVEPSAPLRSIALERLERGGFSERVRVAAAVSSDGPFVGVVVANELLDALPARRVVRSSGHWRELGVRWASGRFHWAEANLAPVRGLPLPEYAEDGVVLEFSPTAEGFVREVADNLVDGVAVLIDYGAEESELVHRPPGGTLRAVRGHRISDDPLDAPGHADLSTFVDFTRIRAQASSAGLVERFYGTQAEALARWGIEPLIDEAVAGAPTSAETVKVRLAAKNLLFGFGTFRVLEAGPDRR